MMRAADIEDANYTLLNRSRNRVGVAATLADFIGRLKPLGKGACVPVRRVFLHVGCPKTGTTFLQSAFWRSVERLRELGVEMPLTGRDHYELALAVRGVHRETGKRAPARDAVQRMARALMATNAATILIGNEMLVGASEEQAAIVHRMLADAVGDAEVHVVITARDLARQAPSEWQQQIQSGRTLSWESFAESLQMDTPLTAYFLPGQDSADVARRWRGALPASHVHIVTLPRPGTPRSVLLERFCSVLNLDPEMLDAGVAELNSSLGFAEVELLRRVNRALGDWPTQLGAEGYERVVKEHLAEQLLGQRSSGGRPTIDASLFAWCGEHTNRMVEEIHRAGYDVVGELDELLPALTMADHSEPVDDAMIADVAVTTLAEMLDQRSRDLLTIDVLQRRCEDLMASAAEGPE